MDAATYLRGLLRSWWLVLLVLLAGGLGGFVVYEQATPQYTSSVGLIVAYRDASTDQLTASTLTELRAGSVARVAPTQPVRTAAGEEADRSDELSDVTVTAVSSDAFVTVTGEGPSAEAVFDLIAAYPAVLPEQTDELTGGSGSEFELKVVAPAEQASEPSSPDLTRNLGLGLVAGLVLGLALAVLRETLNRRVRDTDELRRLTGLPILGIVPRDLPKVPLPSASHPRSARAEAYRQVRTTLLNASARRPLVVAVTSATLGEGKTSVSSNLAVALSRAGHRVVLVDADLRRPQVAKFLQVPSSPGLTDVLTGEVPLERALSLRDEDRFAVLTAGTIPTNPSEALGSTAMHEVLADLVNHFEFVIIDTPPVVPVTDALVLAPWVDGLILVARLGQITPERLDRAQAAAERVQGQVFGIVANSAGKGSDSDYSYTYKSKHAADTPIEDVPVEDRVKQNGSPSGKHSSHRPTIPVTDSGDTAADAEGSRTLG